MISHFSHRPLALLAAAAALLACGRAPASESSTGWVRVAAWELGSEPHVSIGGADAEGAAVLHGARFATRLGDGTIVIADATSRELRFFDSTGRHVRSSGGRGGGPGEFNFLTWLGRMRGDTVLAHDEATRRLALFTPQGDYVRTVELSLPGTPSFPSVVGAFEDGRLLARPSFDRRFGRGERRDTVPFLVYDREGQRADTIARIPGEETYFVSTPEMSSRQQIGFGRNVFAAASGEFAVIGASDAYDVTLFRSSGVPERRLRGERTLERVAPSAERAWRESLGSGMPPQFKARLEPLLEQVPARTTYPAFGGLLLDRGGHLWVMEYPRATEGARRWYVYRPDGSAIATMVTPARMELLEVGDDWLLGRVRDADGVESVELWPLFRR